MPDDLADWADEQDAAARARAERRQARLVHTHVDHDHAPDPSPARLWSTVWGRSLGGAVALLALVTVVGLLVLWPHGSGSGGSPVNAAPTLGAKVREVSEIACPGGAGQTCRQVVVTISSGPDRGTRQTITLGPADTAPTVGVGDKVRVQKATGPASAIAEQYAFTSVDRRGTMAWLAVLFAVLLVVLARWRGLLALAGFAISLLLVTTFVVPAVSNGSSGFGVALIGAFAVMFVTVGLTYGLKPASLAAILGIAASLLLAGGIGLFAVHQARLDGRASDFSQALTQLRGGELSLQGVVLAGLVFGALGVLADQAVTQSSAVMALRRANPAMTVRQVYKEALAVGRDHLVATTHTLVLVYVGATFPLLLVLHAGGVGAVDALNREDLAEPIIATLVGAIALLVSVPLTTALAALIAAPAPPDALPADGGHH
ncbi:MAG TPA: YibE/F family protein [Conexibacter sp.]|jgi:uncharacterized membrane protein